MQLCEVMVRVMQLCRRCGIWGPCRARRGRSNRLQTPSCRLRTPTLTSMAPPAGRRPSPCSRSAAAAHSFGLFCSCIMP
jgi:hypothetical protein